MVDLLKMGFCIKTASVILSLVLLVYSFGCSSVPDFKPTQTVQEASSFEMALDGCASYQIPDENPADKSGSKPHKLSVVSVLTPWIRCFEEALRKFPLSRENEEYVMFFRELQAAHDTVEPAYVEIIDAPAMNLTVKAIVKHLQDPSVVYSIDERALVERTLPQFSIYLAEKGRFGGNWNDGSGHVTRIKETKLEENFSDEKKLRVPDRDRALDKEQEIYCRRYRKYKSLVYNVEELGSYKKLLDQNINQLTLSEKVTKRYEALRLEAQTEGKSLTQAFSALNAKSAWFHNGYCLR